MLHCNDTICSPAENRGCARWLPCVNIARRVAEGWMGGAGGSPTVRINVESYHARLKLRKERELVKEKGIMMVEERTDRACACWCTIIKLHIWDGISKVLWGFISQYVTLPLRNRERENLGGVVWRELWKNENEIKKQKGNWFDRRVWIRCVPHRVWCHRSLLIIGCLWAALFVSLPNELDGD